MKKRLQSKEVFIPLATGTDTERDPRLPGRPTLITKNADFSVPGVVRKREPLAYFLGTTIEGVAQGDLDIGDRLRNMGPSSDGVNTIVFGDGISEIGSAPTLLTDSLKGRQAVTIERDTTLTALISEKAVGTSLEDAVGAGTSFPPPVFFETDTFAGSAVIGTDTRHAFGIKGTCKILSESTGYIFTLSDPCHTFCHSSNAMIGVSQSGTSATVNVFHDRGGLLAAYSNTETWTANNNTSVMVSASIGDDDHFLVLGKSNVSVNTINVTLAGINGGAETASASVSLGAGVNVGILDVTMYNSTVAVFVAGTNCNTSSASIYYGAISINTSAPSLTISTPLSLGLSKTLYTASVGVLDEQAIFACTVKNLAPSPYETFLVRAVKSDISFPAGVPTLSSTSTVGDILGGARAVSKLMPYGGRMLMNVAFHGGRFDGGQSELAADNSGQNFLSLIGFSAASGGRTVALSMYGDFSRPNPRFESTGQSTSLVPLYGFIDLNGNQRYMTSYIRRSGFKSDNRLSSYIAEIALSPGKLRPVQFEGYTMIPGGSPRIYDGIASHLMGSPLYPAIGTSTEADDEFFVGTWTNAGGLDQTYYYAATFGSYTSSGEIIESAPSITASAVPTTGNEIVLVKYVPQFFWGMSEDSGLALSSRPVGVSIYRTDANSSYFYKVASQNTAVNHVDATFYDQGDTVYSAGEEALTKIFISRPLYTMSGDLENSRARQHNASCVHKGRYTYAIYGQNVIQYSKAKVPGIAPEFNEILQIAVPDSGGSIGSLESLDDKLYIFKQRELYATWGEPLNNAGAGSGFADPRLVSKEYGCKYQTASTVVRGQIIFVNGVDGLIYSLSSQDQVQYIGGPVRHYCEQYEYAHVWVNPRQSCVRFGSETSGAPCLSYDYKNNLWSIFDGTYSRGIVAAFAAPAGRTMGLGNSVVDVIMDANGAVFVQDPTYTYGTAESYDLEIETSWIPLNDVAGFGKFYKWVLVGGKPSANCNLELKTAYDYEPFWVDTQTYNATTNVATSPLSDHYGTMASNSVVGKSLQIDVDGSRHKCEAVRLHISTNNATERGNIEIVGARLEIGVREGRYRVGDSRKAS